MSLDYDYLRDYYGEKLGPSHNHFFKVRSEDILKAEKILGCRFPSELREFYTEIGDGFLTQPQWAKNDPHYDFSNTNRIIWPKAVACFFQQITKNKENPQEEALVCDGYCMASDTAEMLQPGDLPFFEIGDSSSFMVMKLHSDNPNTVWYMGAEKVEDSFERFIYKLYHEGPTYYTANW